MLDPSNIPKSTWISTGKKWSDSPPQVKNMVRNFFKVPVDDTSTISWFRLPAHSCFCRIQSWMPQEVWCYLLWGSWLGISLDLVTNMCCLLFLLLICTTRFVLWFLTYFIYSQFNTSCDVLQFAFEFSSKAFVTHDWTCSWNGTVLHGTLSVSCILWLTQHTRGQ